MIEIPRLAILRRLVAIPIARAAIAALAGVVVVLLALPWSHPSSAQPFPESAPGPLSARDDSIVAAASTWDLSAAHLVTTVCNAPDKNADQPLPVSGVNENCSQTIPPSFFAGGATGSASFQMAITLPTVLDVSKAQTITADSTAMVAWNAVTTTAQGGGKAGLGWTGSTSPCFGAQSPSTGPPAGRSGSGTLTFSRIVCGAKPTATSPATLVYAFSGEAHTYWQETPPGFVGPQFDLADVTFRMVITYVRTDIPLDLSVSRVEAVQVVQDDAGTVPLVAGKPTMIRVFPKGDRGIGGGVTARLIGPGGEIILPQNGPIGAGTVFDRAIEDSSLNFLLPIAMATGSYAIVAEVNPDKTITETNYTNNKSAPLQLTFAPASPLSVGYFRYCPRQASGAQPCPGADRATDADFLRALYPVAPNQVTYQPVRQTPVISARSYTTRTDGIRLLRRLGVAYDHWTNPAKPQFLVAVLAASTARPTNMAGLAGDVIGNRHVLLINDLNDLLLNAPWVTLAHEIGHNLGLQHTNRATPPGCGAPGGPVCSCQLAPEAATHWPYQDNEIHGDGWWMDNGLPFLFEPASNYELMAYCPALITWISPDNYRALVNSSLRPKSVAAQALTPQIILSGAVRQDGTGDLDPAFQLLSNDTPDISNPSGTTCLKLSGAAGVLATHCFTPDFSGNGSEAGPVTEQSFVFRISLPPGVTKIALTKGALELASRTAAAQPPNVAITNPKTGDTLTGAQTIQWTGNGAAHLVEASSDGGVTWNPVNIDTDAANLSVDSHDLGSGSNVFVRVIASDGVNNATSTVGPLRVPYFVFVPNARR